MHFRQLAAAAAVLSLCLTAASAAPLRYPPAPRIPVTDTYFGTQVTDPYRWLENAADPNVRSWASQETQLARSFLTSQPAYRWFERRVGALSRISTNRYDLTIAGGRYIYLRATPPQAQAQLVARDGLDAPERVLFDPQSLAASGAPPAIESVFVSHDGSKVAFTTQVGGTEDQTLHVVDAATGRLFSDTLPHIGGGTSPSALAWDGDNNGFIHTQLPTTGPESERKFNIQVYHHTLGTDVASDTYVFGKGLPRTAEMQLETSSDGSQTAAYVAAGDGLHETIYRRSGNGEFTTVATPDEGSGASNHAGGHFVGNALLIVSTRRAAHGEIVAIGPGETAATGHVVVPASDVVIENFAPVAGGFITRDVAGGDAAARSFTTDGKLRGTLAIPPQSSITTLAADPRGGDVIVSIVSYTDPGRWLRYEAATNRLTPTKVGRTAPGDYSRVVVTRVLVPSIDGMVRIPLEITRLRSTPLNSKAPTIVTAYGAYGLVTRPRFLGSTLAWLEQGGVYAQAMIRGGGEYGEEWHRAARLATKTVSSDDLAACSSWLETHGYTSPAHLGIMGGSAGGFLMGLAMTRNPQLYRAVVSEVGIYDLLRVETTPNGAFNTPEFGTVKDPAQFAWMVRQSAYENVRSGVRYPAVLMTTGENDPRVTPWESRKMVARLQNDASTPYPVLLLQKGNQGHGIGNSFAQRVEGTTEWMTFFASQLS